MTHHIIGLLKQMKASMSTEGIDRKRQKKRKIVTFGNVKETNIFRHREVEVKTINKRHLPRFGAPSSVGADGKLAAKLAKSCSSEASEWTERRKRTRLPEVCRIHKSVAIECMLAPPFFVKVDVDLLIGCMLTGGFRPTPTLVRTQLALRTTKCGPSTDHLIFDGVDDLETLEGLQLTW